ncbi:hypothetical protein ACTI_62220 [Actinoplanes sp. OR16]|uniref:hypothetical protein n=1 Tax=Actinoplanes sp. OR16 TaxID=946334 RepID=UPI000F6E312F|nr:hypothetical protein [Actinoplanes sp. OR16]BBH69537.1 hypothetical protein ACTI_62220 [Actinoplanes sp. OR16]
MFPAVCLVLGVAVLVGAFRAAPDELPGFRWYWFLLPILLIWTGDALLGSGRPADERVAKGVLAGFLWLSLAVALIRRRRSVTRGGRP